MTRSRRNSSNSARKERHSRAFDGRDYSGESYSRSGYGQPYDDQYVDYYESDYNDDYSGAHENQYSRRAYEDQFAERNRKKKKHRRIIIGVVVAVLLLLLAGAGVVFAKYSDLSAKLSEGLDSSIGEVLESPVTGDAQYILLMGVDRSQDRADSDQYAGDTFRSDSMILTRVDPKQKTVTLISLHRDTLINMGEYGEQKLNAAHQIGGPGYAVEVVSEFAGVPIHHYAEIDFDGFKAVVDELGGVEVDVPIEIDDSRAGGHIDAGPQTLSGDEALILARARHAYDEYGDGDVYRAANQRLILGSVANKVLSSDLKTIESVVTTAAEYITTDMNLGDIITLAQSLRGIDVEKNVYSIMEPTIATQINGGWYEYVNEPAWKAIMTRVDDGLPPVENEDVYANEGGVVDGSLSKEYIADSAMEAAPASTQPSDSVVVVRNGSGIEGVASEAATVLGNQGYNISDVGNADSSDYDTTIVVYNNDNQFREARAIAESLHIGLAVKNDGLYYFEGDFLVVVGQDY